MGDGGRIAPSSSARERRGERSGGVSGAAFLRVGLLGLVGLLHYALAGRDLCRGSRLRRGAGAAGTISTSFEMFAVAPARGQEKLSARPAGGAGMASPRLIPRAAIGSAAAPPGAGVPTAPRRSPVSAAPALRGTTVPTAARAVPCRRGLGTAPARQCPATPPGPGGSDITRRRSCST